MYVCVLTVIVVEAPSEIKDHELTELRGKHVQLSPSSHLLLFKHGEMTPKKNTNE